MTLGLLVFTAFVIAFLVDGGSLALGSAALIALSIIAVNRDAVFSDETAVSGSVLVVCASIVGFGATSSTIPLLCAAGAALHWDHLRQVRLQRVLVNLGATVVPAFAATGFFRLFADPSWHQNAVAIIGAVGIYWVLNNTFVGVALAIATNQNVGNLVAELIKSDTVMLVFAVGGALCGLVMTEVGTWAGIAALVAALVALNVFVISMPGGPAVLCSARKILAARVFGGLASGLVAVTVTVAVSGGVVAAAAGLGAGIVAGTVIIVGAAALRLMRARHSVDLPLLAGFALAELPLILIAAVAGVVAALGGAAAGFVVASILVILASVGAAWRRRHRKALLVDDDILLAAVTEAIADGMPQPASQH